MQYPRVTVLDHPLLRIRLSELRNVDTPPAAFRTALHQAVLLLATEAARALPTVETTVRTPLEETAGARLARPLVLVPILRAGLGLVEGVLELLPEARVGHLGLYRDEETLKPCHYYCKLPSDLVEADLWILDPMLATGGSATAAAALLEEYAPASLTLLCLVACPEGIAALHDQFPHVRIVTAVIDRQLDHKGYILPGLGDAGDRLFGTD